MHMANEYSIDQLEVVSVKSGKVFPLKGAQGYSFAKRMPNEFKIRERKVDQRTKEGRAMKAKVKVTGGG
jgi:hypothetical protein